MRTRNARPSHVILSEAKNPSHNRCKSLERPFAALRVTNTQTRRRAFVLMPTLAVMFFIAAMVTVALQENATQRTYLKRQKDSLDAFYLAESGAQEAMHRISAGLQAGSFAREVGNGFVSVEWTPVEGGFRIVSTGVGRRTAPEASSRTMTTTVNLTTETRRHGER